jgi:hypothetical protein
VVDRSGERWWTCTEGRREAADGGLLGQRHGGTEVVDRGGDRQWTYAEGRREAVDGGLRAVVRTHGGSGQGGCGGQGRQMDDVGEVEVGDRGGGCGGHWTRMTLGFGRKKLVSPGRRGGGGG